MEVKRYIVKNTALNKWFTKFEKEKIEDFTNEELVEICETSAEEGGLGLPVQASIRKETDNQGRDLGTIQGGMAVIGSSVFSRDKTEKMLKKATEVNFYIQLRFWTPEMQEVATKYEWFEQLKDHATGEQTLKMFADKGYGIQGLQAGEEKEIDLPVKFVEYLRNENPQFFPKSGKVSMRIKGEK